MLRFPLPEHLLICTAAPQTRLSGRSAEKPSMNVLRAPATFAALAVLVASPLVALAKAHVVDTSAAPLDEYFGPQKMSAIGVRMRIDALGRRYHARQTTDGDLLHDGEITEASLRAWDAKYPRDPWLAPTAYHLEQLYALVPSPEGHARAMTMLHFVVDTFGSTRFGHLGRLRLAQGFPQPTPRADASAQPAVAASGEPTGAVPPPVPASSAAPAPAVPSAAASAVPSGPAR